MQTFIDARFLRKPYLYFQTVPSSDKPCSKSFFEINI